MNRAVVDEAARTLAAAGAKVRELDAKRLRRAFLIWSSMMASSGGPSYSRILGNGDDVSISRELVKLGLKRSRHTLPALVIAGVEKITDKTRMAVTVSEVIHKRLDLLFHIFHPRSTVVNLLLLFMTSQ